MKTIVLALILSIFHSSLAFGQVAKVIILKGDVKAVINGQTSEVKKDQWLPEGAELKTASKSFVKLLFVDKSQMNLGPDSEMKIQTFPKEKAGIINLVKGELRSKVTKDYMQMEDKNKSKLFIKTQTAAMGVRGTDFEVSFDPQNAATKLEVYEGKVAMAPLPDNFTAISQQGLESAVSGPKAAMVERGVQAEVGKNTSDAPKTEKIPEEKMKESEKNDVPSGENSSDDKKDEKSDGKSEEKSEEKSDGKSEEKSEEKSDGKSEEKSEEKSDGKSEEKSEAKSDGKSEEKSEAKSDGKSEEKSEAKTADKSEKNSEGSSDSKSPNSSNQKMENKAAPMNSGESKKEMGSTSGQSGPARDIIPPGVPKSAFTNNSSIAAPEPFRGPASMNGPNPPSGPPGAANNPNAGWTSSAPPPPPKMDPSGAMPPNGAPPPNFPPPPLPPPDMILPPPPPPPVVPPSDIPGTGANPLGDKTKVKIDIRLN